MSFYTKGWFGYQSDIVKIEYNEIIEDADLVEDWRKDKKEIEHCPSWCLLN